MDDTPLYTLQNARLSFGDFKRGIKFVRPDVFIRMN